MPAGWISQHFKPSGIALCSLFSLECKPTFIFLFRDFTRREIDIEDGFLRAWALKVTDFLKSICDFEKPSKTHPNGDPTHSQGPFLLAPPWQSKVKLIRGDGSILLILYIIYVTCGLWGSVDVDDS